MQPGNVDVLLRRATRDHGDCPLCVTSVVFAVIASVVSFGCFPIP